MQDDELATLRMLREEVTRIGEALDRAIARREEKARKPGIVIIGPWVAAAVAAAGAAGRWAGRNSAAVAAFGAGAVISAAAAVGIVQLSDDPPAGRHVLTAPLPAPSATPRAGHTPAPTGPPQDSPSPAPPPTVPTPTPTTPGPDMPPPARGSEPPKTKPPKTHKPPKPPKPPHTPPGKPPADDDGPVTTKDDCRIHLLGHGMLCGRLFSSRQLPPIV